METYLDTFYAAIQFFSLVFEAKKWFHVIHTEEREKNFFHGKLNENKKVFYNFSIRFYIAWVTIRVLQLLFFILICLPLPSW